MALTCLAFGLTTPCAFGFLSGIPGILFGVWALRCTPPERWGLRWVTYVGITLSVIGTVVTTIGLFMTAVR